MNITQGSKQDKYILLSFLLFSFITLFFGTKSSPLYLFNDLVDPNAYFTMGKGWINGYIPYKDLFDHKGPLLYIIFGIGYIISNDSFLGIYILQSISFAIVLYFIYKLAHLFLSKQYAYISSLFFSLVYYAINLQGGCPEEFILLFQAVGLYLFIKHFVDKNNPRNLLNIFIQGVLIGCVALIKFNLIVFWFIPLFAIIIQTILDNNFKLTLKYIIFTTFGVLIVIAPFIIYFFIVNGLTDFWESYIIFNTLYASTNFDLNFFLLTFVVVLKLHPILSSFIILGITYFTFNKRLIKQAIFRLSLFPLFIFIYFIIFKSAYYSHYLIAISIFSVLGIIAVFCIIQKRYNKINYQHIIISFLLVIGISVYLKRKMIANINKESYQIEFARYMKENSNKNDLSILSLGLDEGYFLLTNTIPIYKYFYQPNISYNQYPLIVNTNLEIIKSNKAPLYITISKQITKEDTKADINLYLSVLESKYDKVKEYTSYEEWPGQQHILYKRKN